MITQQQILFLEKILHLGKDLENKNKFEILEPWDFNGYDPIEIQKAGKKISNFIGLKDLTFVITFKKQEEGIAGHIELNNNSDEGVFIEIDESYKSEPSIILAILAHEICHKIIHVNGLTQFGYENEILTDIATVFCGLGKLSLNGCELIRTITTNNTRNTTTKKVGYLVREQFSFVYNVICNMRKIPDKIRLKGLTNEVIISLSENQSKHFDFLYSNEDTSKNIESILHKKNKKNHLILSENIKLLKIYQDNFKTIKSVNSSIHKKINLEIKDTLSEAIKKMPHINLNYIKNILLYNKTNNNQSEFHEEINHFKKLNRNFKELLFTLKGSLSLNLENRNSLYDVLCPICNNKMRLNQDKLVKITCTKCKYKYMIDNSIIRKDTSQKKEKKTSYKNKWKKIMNIIKE